MRQPAALDADAVRRLLALDGTPVHPVAEGSEHATWLIGDDRVLRLAGDEEVTVRQRREVALRDALRPRLPVPVPGSLATGEWAPGLSYTVDNRLPGRSAEERPVSGAGELDLSGLLAALRAYDPGDATGPALPPEPVRDPAEVGERALVAARRLAADHSLDTGLVHRRLTDAPQPAAPDSAVLLHNDLKGEHLLTGDDGGITGVLDWTDAALGDPAEDIAGLAISIGAPAAVRASALASYGPDVCLRGVWLARCDTLTRLADRLYGSDDSPLDLLRAQRRRAWQLTPLDL
ncbi:aminoglycoside phosphotransferase family protein [Streptomyces sp. NPDC006798]|uniref:phosphotransferase family protein n=1 Tax=Streptomyces sp. NPDC006798 TaxID=3155462 RepID=UPI0033D3D582